MEIIAALSVLYCKWTIASARATPLMMLLVLSAFAMTPATKLTTTKQLVRRAVVRSAR